MPCALFLFSTRGPLFDRRPLAPNFLGCLSCFSILCWSAPRLFSTSIFLRRCRAGRRHRSKSLLKDIASYLIAAQVGILGIVSVAIGIVTLISQRDDRSSTNTDVRLYYVESLAYEVVLSGAALLIVLCVQLLWPASISCASRVFSAAPHLAFKALADGLPFGLASTQSGGVRSICAYDASFRRAERPGAASRTIYRERHRSDRSDPASIAHVLRERTQRTGPRHERRSGPSDYLRLWNVGRRRCRTRPNSFYPVDYLPDQPEVDRKDDTSCHETDQDHHSILFETGQRDKSDQKSGKDIARFALASSSRRAFDDVKIEIVRTKQPRPSRSSLRTAGYFGVGCSL